MKKLISALENDQLKYRFERLARTERKVTALVIEYIAEISRRDLHLRWGYASLFDYLVKGMGYSESAAYRRIQAARAFRQIPEIKEALEDGTLKLSQVSQVQTALRREEQATGEKISVEARADLFSEVAGQSGAATQRILDTYLVHQTESRQQVTHKRDDSVELNLVIPKEAFEELKRVKELYAHIDPFADWVKVITLMAKDVIKKRDPTAADSIKSKNGHKTNYRTDKKPVNATEVMTRGFAATEVDTLNSSRGGTRKFLPTRPFKRQPIPARIKRLVFHRDEGKCQYRGPDGKLCGTRFQAQVDHITPVFAGGSNEPDNLRLLCRSHNIFRYRKNA